MLELLASLYGRPWAIRADIAAHAQALLSSGGFAALRELAAVKASVHATDEHAAAAAGVSGRRRPATNVAVVPIIGTMTQRGDVIASAETRSVDAIRAEVSAAAADPTVGAIVLDVDSPGGHVNGVPEAAAVIREVRQKKPVIAAVNSQAGSAAYWLASSATEIIVTPSGEVGSIGVYALHRFIGKRLEQEGETWTFVSAGKYKVEGNPVEPLGDEARAAIQTDVDAIYGMFVADVAKGRGRNVSVDQVREGFGEGRMVMAKRAVKDGMADAVGTFDEAILRAAALASERAEAKRSAQERARALAELGVR